MGEEVPGPHCHAKFHHYFPKIIKIGKFWYKFECMSGLNTAKDF